MACNNHIIYKHHSAKTVKLIAMPSVFQRAGGMWRVDLWGLGEGEGGEGVL